jgi:hypothetical protein
MTTVYYPGMGVDIITPVVCVPKVERIIATGPYEGTFTGKNQMQKVFDCICRLANTGAIQDEETGEWVEFWPQPVFDEDVIVPVIKKYFFKTTGMWLMQFRYQTRVITLNYYVQLNPNDKNFKPPESVLRDKVDYIIHKSFKWKINPTIYNQVLKDCCKFDKKKDEQGNVECKTKLIGTKDDLRGAWSIPKSEFASENGVVPTQIQEYEHIVEQTKYTDNEERPLFAVDISKSTFYKKE